MRPRARAHSYDRFNAIAQMFSTFACVDFLPPGIWLNVYAIYLFRVHVHVCVCVDSKSVYSVRLGKKRW